MKPSCDPSEMQRVCRNFFQWTLHCSNNKIDQPGYLGAFTSCLPVISRRLWDAGALDCVVSWLSTYGAFHVDDPTKTHIILANATHKQVYENYAADFDVETEKRIYPRRQNGFLYLPSKSYFC